MREKAKSWRLATHLLKGSAAGILASLLLLTGCDKSLNNSEAVASTAITVSEQGLQDVVNATVDQVILPDLKLWQQQSQQFYEASQNFCKAPNQASFQLLKNRYEELSYAWNRSIVFDFGPLRDNLFFPKIHFIESSRQRGTDYSNSIKTHIKQRLSDEIALDEAYFEKLKFTLVGMPALEVLLYEQTAEESVVSFQQARKCQLLTGTAKLNAAAADYVVEGWETPREGVTLSYREQFISNQLPDGEKSLTKLIFGMQDYLRYIKQRKLNTKTDSALSGLSYHNLRAGLNATEAAFTINHSGYSVYDYLIKADEASVANTFVAEIKAALGAIEQQNIEEIKAHYSVLIKLLEKEVPEALGVNLGLNFVDGD